MPQLIERLVREAYAATGFRRIRTFRQFAEQEVVLATGPKQGRLFRCDTVPFSAEILAEFDRSAYWRFFISGPSQDGKSMLGFILPALYELFERKRDVILGAPVVEMAQAAWRERLLPSVEMTRYRELLPRKGGGSRGGDSLSMQFEHGPRLRFMGAGGGDSQRSSYTAPVVIMTELDKMDDSGSASEETDPVSQMEERSSSFRSAGLARTYGECTMSTKRGRIYREVCEIGTDSRVFLRCPYCGEYCYPERASFGGWQDAKEISEARDRAAFMCPGKGCGKPWTEMDRRRALLSYRVVARGQAVTAAGELAGERPRTHTYGFRWNSMHSSFKTMADIGEAEWLAERADTESERKKVIQFRWAEPWESGKLDLVGLTKEIIQSKVTQHPRGESPADAMKLVVAIDGGLHFCWWVAVAWRPEARGHVVDYGAIEVPQERQPDPARILSALREFRTGKLQPGWVIGGVQRSPDLVLIDSGYEPEIIYQFARETPRCFASKGFGSSKKNAGRWRAGQKSSPDREVGNEWALAVLRPSGVRLVEIHTDHWKSEVHAGFAAPPAAPGSITIFQGEQSTHRSFARHITAEERRQEFVQGEGTVTYWEVLRDANHWLDCMTYARAAGDMLGIKRILPTKPAGKTAQPQDRDQAPRLRWDRDKY